MTKRKKQKTWLEQRKSAASTDEYGLTPKQRRFCDHLLADPEQNRRGAYIAAGYSSHNMQKVDRCIFMMMRLPHIMGYLQERRKQLSYETDLSQSRVLHELCNIGFVDPGDLYHDDGRPRALQEIPMKARKAIAQIDVFTEYEGRGSERQAVGQTTRFKLVDKKGALDSIARILGFFQQDKIDTDGVAKLMELIGQSRGQSTIGRLNRDATQGNRSLPGSVVEDKQPVLDTGQGGQRGPLSSQLGATAAAQRLLVHECDTEGEAAGDDDLHRHPVTG